MKPLSEKQRGILTYLKQFIEEKGYPPSIRDIVRACGISSTSVVDYNLNVLKRLGFLRRDADVSRGIEILDDNLRPGSARIPVIGTIAAGQPLPVPESTSRAFDAEDVVDLTQDFFGRSGEVFALRVKGLSMVEDLINDGDVVVLQPARTATNGDTVAAWLVEEQETTLKRFYDEGDRIRLQPANSQMEPIYARPDNVEIQGKVVGVVRRL